MAKNMLISLFACCLAGVVLCARPQDARFNTDQYARDWCAAQIGAPADKLQQFLDYACGVNDCSAIQPGAVCFEPNDVVSHTSYALNQEYRRTGVCHTDIGTITTNDPSHDACNYP